MQNTPSFLSATAATAAAAVLFLALMPQPTGSIMCYKCDALKQERSDCPGTYRRPVDTFRDLGDRGGLYTHCLEIKLRNGTVVHQVRKKHCFSS